MIPIIAVISLLALAPSAVFGIVCNADNVLRALRANSASASPFCSTYTLPPPNQPLPTYVSAYPASRVSSGCSCLNTPTSTTLTTSTTRSSTATSTSVSTTSSTSTTSATPTPTEDACTANHIRNGGFQTLINGKPDPWILSPPMDSGAGQSSDTSVRSDNGNNYAFLSITNRVDPGYGTTSTTISQPIPRLCPYTSYTLTYSSQIFISGGDRSHACSVSYSLADGGQLVFIGPPNGDIPPFDYEVRQTTFRYYGSGGANTLTIQLSCNAPVGGYRVDDVSLVGTPQ